MRRLAFALATFSVASAAVLYAACGADDADAPLAMETDAAEGQLDAFANEDGGDSAPSCRVAAFADSRCAKNVAECVRRHLFVSASAGYPFGIVTDDEYVYWLSQVTTDAGSGDLGRADAIITRVPRIDAPSPPPSVEIARGQTRATLLARDGADLYWITSVSSDAGVKSTMRRLRNAKTAAPCSGSCGPTEDLVDFDGAAEKLVHVSDGVFFAALSDGTILRIARASTGGAFSASKVATTSAAPSLATDGKDVFAGGGTFGRVLRIPGAGGAPSELFALPPRPPRIVDAGPDADASVIDGGPLGASLLTTDCANVYGVRDGGELWESPVASPAAALAASIANGASAKTTYRDIVVDERFVWFASPSDGVFRIAHDGTGVTGELEQVYTGGVWALAIDDEGVYWGEHKSSAIIGNVYFQKK